MIRRWFHTYVLNCLMVIPHHSAMLAQVSVSEAICQYVQSSMVSGDAGVSGSTMYAALRRGSAPRAKVEKRILTKARCKDLA